MKNTRTLNKILILIIVFGVVIRLLLFFHFLDTPNFFYDDDSAGYIQIAENVRLGHGFSLDSVPPFGPDPFRTPAYPLFLLFHRITLGSYYPALLTQILMVAAIAYMVYLIARDFLGRPVVGLISAALFLAAPFSIMVTLRFLTQTLFTFFLMLAVLFWLKYLKTAKMNYFVWAMIFLPICALVRPIAFLIVIPFFMSLITYKMLTKDIRFEWKKIALLFVGAVIIFVGILSPWLTRNYRVFGSFSLSTITNFQLYFYDLPYIYAHNKGIAVGDASKILEQDFHNLTGQTTTHVYTQQFSYSKLIKQRLFYYLAQMPGAAVITRVELMFKFFVRDGIRYWLHFYDQELGGWALVSVIVEKSILFIIFLSMIISVFHGFMSRNKEEILYINVLFWVLLYFAFLTGVMASAGLRFPVEAIFILTGVAGINQVYFALRNKKGLFLKGPNSFLEE